MATTWLASAGGKSATIFVPSGVHEMQGRMDWVLTEPVAVNGDADDRAV